MTALDGVVSSDVLSTPSSVTSLIGCEPSGGGGRGVLASEVIFEKRLLLSLTNEVGSLARTSSHAPDPFRFIPSGRKLPARDPFVNFLGFEGAF